MKNSMAMLGLRITQCYREARMEMSYCPVLQTMALYLLWKEKNDYAVIDLDDFHLRYMMRVVNMLNS